MSTAQAARREGMPTVSRLGTIRRQVLECLATPRTAEEVAGLIDLAVYVVRPRITELRKDGLVVETGERRQDATGKRNTVWQATGGAGAGKPERVGSLAPEPDASVSPASLSGLTQRQLWELW